MINEFEEFRKQYEKTYIRVKFENLPNKQVIVVRECVIETNESGYIVVHSDRLGQCILSWSKSKQIIDYSFPTIGLFNYDSGFLMFYRHPDRQWKRGITSGNSIIKTPFRDIQIKTGSYFGPDSVLNYNSLEAAYSNIYPSSITNACAQLIDNNLLGIALNSTFAISKNPTKDSTLLLWKHLNMIGYVYPQTETINVVEIIFKQEVIDFLKRTLEFSWKLNENQN